MKYYVLRFLQLSTKDSPDVTPLATTTDYDEAKKLFHTYMGSNINSTNENVLSVMAIVFNSVGNVELMERWDRPIPKPEPETPEEPENPEESTEPEEPEEP